MFLIRSIPYWICDLKILLSYHSVSCARSYNLITDYVEMLFVGRIFLKWLLRRGRFFLHNCQCITQRFQYSNYAVYVRRMDSICMPCYYWLFFPHSSDNCFCIKLFCSRASTMAVIMDFARLIISSSSGVKSNVALKSFHFVAIIHHSSLFRLILAFLSVLDFCLNSLIKSAVGSLPLLSL